MPYFRFMLALIAAIATPPLSSAAEDVPIFWDSRQHLAAPDMSAFQHLRFLTTTDFFPFSMLDQQGNLVGFHIDLARAICRQLNIENRCQIQAMPFEELGPALQKQEGDAIIAGLAVTSENRAIYDFSRPYFQFPARFITRKSEPLDEPLYRAVQGKRVGIIKGSAHETMLSDLFSGIDIAPYSDNSKMFEAIRKGEIAAMFGDGMRLSFAMTDPIAASCCNFAGGPYLAPEYLGHGLTIATRHDQSALIDAFDYALQRLEADGIFIELYLRYFPINFYEQAGR